MDQTRPKPGCRFSWAQGSRDPVALMRLYERGYYTSGAGPTLGWSSVCGVGEEGRRLRVRRRVVMDHELAGRWSGLLLQLWLRAAMCSPVQHCNLEQSFPLSWVAANYCVWRVERVPEHCVLAGAADSVMRQALPGCGDLPLRRVGEPVLVRERHR